MTKPKEVKIVVSENSRYYQPHMPLDLNDGEHVFIEKNAYEKIIKENKNLKTEIANLKEFLKEYS